MAYNELKNVGLTRSPRTVVRCSNPKNKYQNQTPLFSYDDLGLYVKCKDCKTVGTDGQEHRGAFHLVPWATVERLRLGLIREDEIIVRHSFVQEEVADGGVTESSDSEAESVT